MIIGFGNNIVSALAGDITAAQTDIPVMPGTGAKFGRILTADYENKSNAQRIYAKITLTDNKESAFEICHLVSVSGDVLNVIRGQEGTTPKGWLLNDVVANFATRGSENHFVQIAQLQSGHYVSGIAGGTANALTLELPATFFENGGTDWALRTPLIVFPSSNNTGAATLQLAMGGRALGTFPLFKGGNRAELSPNDIVAGAPLICVLDQTKTYFSVVNPGAIYSDFDLRYVKKAGDTMTGKLTLPQTSAFGVNTDNTLGGNSIVLGDSDTGIKQSGDGIFDIIADGVQTGRVISTALQVNNQSGGWLSMKEQRCFAGQNAVTTSAASALIRQEHADHFFILGGLGNSQFGFYRIAKTRATNGTDGQAYLGVDGHFYCSSGQLIPGSYANFDARYQARGNFVQDIRLGSVAASPTASSQTTDVPGGCVMTGVTLDVWGSRGTHVTHMRYRPLQKLINGTWYNVTSI